MATLNEILARQYSFRVEADLEAGGWFIWFPDLPGCMTQADTFAEIGEMAEDAFRGWVEVAYEAGQAIPPPSDTAGDGHDRWSREPLPMRDRRAPSLTAAEVAERLGVSLRRVSALAKSRDAGTMFGRYRLFSEDDVDAMRPRQPGRPARSGERRVA